MAAPEQEKHRPQLAAPDPLTAEELAGADLIRSHLAIAGVELPELFKSDFFLARWFRAHRGNLEEVERRMRELLTHRATLSYGDKSVEEWFAMEGSEFSSQTIKKFATANLRMDAFSDDVIVWAQKMEGVDLREILKCLPLSHVLHSYFIVQERFTQDMLEHERRTGRQSAVVVIIDLEGLSIADFLNPVSASSKLARLVVKIWSDYFSENLIRLYLLKPPTMVSILWQIAKHILDAKTHSRIVFLQRPEELFDYLRPEAIPEAYGGRRRDDTGFCVVPESCISEPQRITPQLYFNLDEWWAGESGGKKVKPSSAWNHVGLKAGQRHEVMVNDCQVGDRLLWALATNNDIEFEITLLHPQQHQNPASAAKNGTAKNGSAKNGTAAASKGHHQSTVVWPKITLTSVMKTPEHGRIECRTAGTYCIVIKNPSSHSWFSAKIHYHWELVKAGAGK